MTTTEKWAVTVWINILAVLNFERHWQEGLYYFLTFLRTRTHAQTDRRSYRLFKWELIVFCQNDRHHLVLCWSDTFFSVSTTFAPNNCNSYWGHISVSPQEGKAYYEQTGVGPLPVVLYNGMPLQREQLDPDELETVVMHKILETTSFFQRAVYLVRMSFFYFDLTCLWQNTNYCSPSKIVKTKTKSNIGVTSAKTKYTDLSFFPCFIQSHVLFD